MLHPFTTKSITTTKHHPSRCRKHASIVGSATSKYELKGPLCSVQPLKCPFLAPSHPQLVAVIVVCSIINKVHPLAFGYMGLFSYYLSLLIKIPQSTREKLTRSSSSRWKGWRTGDCSIKRQDANNGWLQLTQDQNQLNAHVHEDLTILY